MARLSFRPGDDAASATTCVIACLQAWENGPGARARRSILDARRGVNSRNSISNNRFAVPSVKGAMTTFLYDLRHAARTLRRYPGFCAVVVLTLGLGIGVNTATFSVINAVLLRPLGFPDPDRLVALHVNMPWAGLEGAPFSAPDFVDLARDQQLFTGVAAYVNTPFELSGGSAPTRIDAARVSANLFSVLDVTPALGRGFTPDDDRTGVDVAVLSWGLWQAQYQGDPAIVGKTVMLDRRLYTVIGVMPATFEFPRRGPAIGNKPASVWVPVAFTPAQLRERGNGVIHSVVARLKEGISIDEARAEVSVVARRIGDQYPPAARKGPAMGMTVTPLHEEIIPLLALERRTPGAALQEEATRTTPGTRRHRLQAGLVVSTVGLSFVLLVGAGLFIRSFSALMARDAGFDAESVLTASVVLPRAGYANAASVRTFHTTLLAGPLP
jgi:hypothetical protein